MASDANVSHHSPLDEEFIPQQPHDELHPSAAHEHESKTVHHDMPLDTDLMLAPVGSDDPLGLTIRDERQMSPDDEDKYGDERDDSPMPAHNGHEQSDKQGGEQGDEGHASPLSGGHHGAHDSGHHGVHDIGHHGAHDDGHRGVHDDGHHGVHDDGHRGVHDDGHHGVRDSGHHGAHDDEHHGVHDGGHHGVHDIGRHGAHDDGHHGAHDDEHHGVHGGAHPPHDAVTDLVNFDTDDGTKRNGASEPHKDKEPAHGDGVPNKDDEHDDRKNVVTEEHCVLKIISHDTQLDEELPSPPSAAEQDEPLSMPSPQSDQQHHLIDEDVITGGELPREHVLFHDNPAFETEHAVGSTIATTIGRENGGVDLLQFESDQIGAMPVPTRQPEVHDAEHDHPGDMTALAQNLNALVIDDRTPKHPQKEKSSEKPTSTDRAKKSPVRTTSDSVKKSPAATTTTTVKKSPIGTSTTSAKKSPISTAAATHTGAAGHAATARPPPTTKTAAPKPPSAIRERNAVTSKTTTAPTSKTTTAPTTRRTIAAKPSPSVDKPSTNRPTPATPPTTTAAAAAKRPERRPLTTPTSASTTAKPTPPRSAPSNAPKTSTHPTAGAGHVKTETRKPIVNATKPKVGAAAATTTAADHKPSGVAVEKKLPGQKLEWKADSKIGSLSNASHKPAGGTVKVVSSKLEWKASSKIGFRDNEKHVPGGGDKRIESKKLEWKAESKVGSKDNVKHVPGGGAKKVCIFGVPSIVSSLRATGHFTLVDQNKEQMQNTSFRCFLKN
jgi:microtubule-associated protein tau